MADTTVSDTASATPDKDISGPILKNLLEKGQDTKTTFRVDATACIPDEFDKIQEIVKNWCDEKKLALVITTGGTGFGVRDLTPEAITPLLEKLSPGLTYAMISSSLKKTPFAALSRPVSGIRGKSIILTLPGSPKGAKENLEAVLSILPHAIELVSGGTGEKVHRNMREKSSDHESTKTVAHDSHQCLHHKNTYSSENHGSETLLSNSLSVPVTKRHRKSPYPAIAINDALKIVNDHLQNLETIEVPVNEKLIGYVLAQDVTAKENVPGYRASIVDGYAVVASDGPGVYPVTAISLATSSASTTSLQSGQITRITTGGCVPPGATAVVMVEDTTLVRTSADGENEELVEIHVQSREGSKIREVGSDIAIGETVGRRGELVSAMEGEIGILASSGIKSVHVFRHPVIGVLSTGNEVADHNEAIELKYGEIRDTNRPTLLSIIQSVGFEAKDFGISRDSPQELESKLRSALPEVDVLITTGGVSMGEMDLLKTILERSLGAKIHFGRVWLKPGLPTTFATIKLNEEQAREKLIFALPGNPVSAIVTFYVFVLPALRKMSGYTNWELPTVKVQLSNTIKLDPRPEFHRVIIHFDHETGNFKANSTGIQQSSRLLSLRGCNALLKLPAREDLLSELSKGTFVEAIVIGQLLDSSMIKNGV
ncbi:10494_t:CDS:2 [Ambispora leptoticha]|uniref:10494_t:CDS:1 n=1 Tax=Ambispora leptoticha TaxID=144679 RepID=A0A9N9AQ34_9GLOM|nr:10494_t:CDS:2 [Ambispora leptoticha]